MIAALIVYALGATFVVLVLYTMGFFDDSDEKTVPEESRNRE